MGEEEKEKKEMALSIPLPVIVVCELAITVMVVVSYLDAKEASVPTQEELEFITASYLGFCFSVALFSILAVVGNQTGSHKLVAGLKFSLFFKIMCGIAVVIALAAMQDDVCAEAKAADFAWYSFDSEDKCSTVLLFLCLPIVA